MTTIERVSAPSDELRALIGELDAWLAERYSVEQRHGLSLDALFAPNVRFFIARADDAAVGCGGVAFFDDYAEVKRMYVREHARGTGVAQALLAAVERAALDARCTMLRLETGIHQPAAITMYTRAGFTRCSAFGSYAAMATDAIVASIFMEKPLR
jgi:putative acetyltransferase